jgi:hypothetical protein
MASQFERLNRLYELSKKSNADQREWGSCLWAEAVHDKLLVSMGLPTRCDNIGGPVAYEPLREFFGVSSVEIDHIFSGQDMLVKRNYLAAKLLALRQQSRIEEVV